MVLIFSVKIFSGDSIYVSMAPVTMTASMFKSCDDSTNKYKPSFFFHWHFLTVRFERNLKNCSKSRSCGNIMLQNLHVPCSVSTLQQQF